MSQRVYGRKRRDDTRMSCVLMGNTQRIPWAGTFCLRQTEGVWGCSGPWDPRGARLNVGACREDRGEK